MNLTPTCETLAQRDEAIRSPEDHGFFRVGTTRSGFAHYAGVSEAEVVRFYPKQVPSGGRQTSYTINETRLWVRDGRYFCLGLQSSGPAETFPLRQVESLLASLEGNLSAGEVEMLRDAASRGGDTRIFPIITYSSNVPGISRPSDAVEIEINGNPQELIILTRYPSSWIQGFLL